MKASHFAILFIIFQALVSAKTNDSVLSTSTEVKSTDFPVDEKPVSDKCLTKKGLTWQHLDHHCESGLDKVGCAGCNPYTGDTVCEKELPILCIYKAKMPRPAYKIDCSPYAMPSEFYCGWTGGYIKATKPYKGCEIQSKEHADKICKISFGDCWEMAAHGDGYYIQGMNESKYTYCEWDWKLAKSGGWSSYSFGNLNTYKEQRFWTFIHDQPGNCWN